MVVGLGFGTIVTIVALVIVMSFKVLREYQRAVVFMLVPVHLRAAQVAVPRSGGACAVGRAAARSCDESA